MMLEKQISGDQISDLLGKMASPDYQCMTSIPCDNVTMGTDGYLAPDVIISASDNISTDVVTENGYLVPNMSPIDKNLPDKINYTKI